MSGRRYPRRCTPGQLAKVGVTIADRSSRILECLACGRRWIPLLQSGGRLPRGYWKCPYEQCNH